MKAIRMTISMGDFPIEVFMLPTGEYRLSQTQILEVINVAKNWITELDKKNKKAVKALQARGYTGLDIPVKLEEEGNRGVKSAKTISIDDAVKIWSYFNRAGNERAADILEACAAEAIERRADKAFKIKREEEEYNERMKVRIAGKKIRRKLTDAIKAYIDRHPELSENTCKWVYVNASQRVDLVVFGRKAAKVAEDLGVERSSLRDALTTDELLLLQEVEDVAVRLIDLQDINPDEAVKQAAERLLIQVQNRVANQDRAKALVGAADE